MMGWLHLIYGFYLIFNILVGKINHFNIVLIGDVVGLLGILHHQIIDSLLYSRSNNYILVEVEAAERIFPRDVALFWRPR